MAIRVESVELLKKYFGGVAERSEHHGLNVNRVIYPLLGLVVLKMDEDTDIQVKEYAGAPGNLLWVYINGTRYALRYEHVDQTIEIRKESMRGDLLHKIDNGTSIDDLYQIFESL